MKNSSILFALILLLTSSYGSTRIYEWRGPARSGIFNEPNLLKTWPAEGPKELWAINNIGNGFVSPIFADENFYISGEIDSMEILFSYNQGIIKKVSSFRIKQGTLQHFSHPVIYKGVLYQRHGNTLIAFDIHKK